ncbi:hypothetical protein E2C01_024574 [Portunus trituberculatus]|uniref:Uncharacterized protein n=1 Tax=Portunus trituberculatus TaxID=210409 RepID=A0A5B7ED73_PORTR|nr:hypothetical protein [Portunus trituberculatus]
MTNSVDCGHMRNKKRHRTYYTSAPDSNLRSGIYLKYLNKNFQVTVRQHCCRPLAARVQGEIIVDLS